MLPDLRYLGPRVIRHFMPDEAVRFLLTRSIIIRPGAETRTPLEAVERYLSDLEQKGIPWQGRRVLILGYGGRFDVACRLLERGVGQVTLVEKSAFRADRHNKYLLSQYGSYLACEGNRVVPRPEYIRLYHEDIHTLVRRPDFSPADILLSNSVFEHLEDVDGITRVLADLAAPGGVNLHYIDLRDHFFKYPFEMLCYSEKTWRRWLDPGSHHNRLRLPDYERILRQYFGQVELDILAREEIAFLAARSRIRPEFLTGSPQIDSVSLVRVWAQQPLTGPD